MTPEIRKLVTYDEETLIEGYKPAATPWRMIAVAAIVRNPWAGRYVEDLSPEIYAYGPFLGELLTDRITEMRVNGEYPDAGDRTDTVEMAGAEWQYTSKIATIPDLEMRRLDVTVAFADTPNNVITTVIGFLGHSMAIAFSMRSKISASVAREQPKLRRR